MSNEIQAEIVHNTMESGSGTELVRESDAVEKVDVATALDDLVAQRKLEHPEWYNEPSPEETVEDEPEAEPEQAEAAADEQAGDKDPEPEVKTSEPESKALKRILQRESKLREEKAEFESKQQEYQAKIEEYEQAKQLATLDPVSYLKTLGVSQEDLVKVAEAAYYESLGDNAPDAYRGQKEALALKKEVESLKARLEAKEKQPEVAPDESLVAYQGELIEATKSFDIEAFPATAKIVSEYSEMAVAADMYAVAEEHAQKMQGMGEPLTPEQCLAEVEARYTQLLQRLSPAQVEKKKQAAQEEKPAKKTLSNSMSSNVPPEKPLEGLSYEEIKERSRANFFKAMRGGD